MRRWFDRRTLLLFTLPALVLHSLFFVWPVIRGFLFSLTDWNGISRSFNVIGLRNYADLVRDARILDSLGFTLRYVAALVVCVAVFGMASALLIDVQVRGRGVRLKSFFRSLYFYPAVLSLVTVGLVFNQIFLNALPAVGEALGIEWLSASLLARPQTAPLGILIVGVWQGTALPTILFLAGLQSVPVTPIESALVDGAKPHQVFLHVKLPYLIPVLNMVVILTLKNGITMFDYVMAMTGGGPARATESVGLLIYRFAFGGELKFGYGTALSIVLFAVIAMVSVLQIKGLRRLEVVA
ncbi:MAG: sugar ABC transporter permease [Spirochaetales bacterium]|nr:sugar ABC transporter permease [Spirochaetales bacterium]